MRVVVAHCFCGVHLQWTPDDGPNGDGLVRHYKLVHPERWKDPDVQARVQQFTRTANAQVTNQPL